MTLATLTGRAAAVALTTVVAASALTGCGSDDTSGSGSKTVTIHVFAAASLTEAFTTLGKKFEKDHPGTKVELNFGPSSGLAEQITGGAPADVFASASPSNMDTLVQGGDASDPKDFAKNSGEIAVPPDNPAGIATVADLAKPGVKVAVCQAQVPCGKVATEIFASSKVAVKPVTEEVDVKSVLTKVTLGEVDAGLVYVTDVKAAGDKVKGIEIPEAQNSVTSYPIATLKDSKHEKQASEFVDLVLSDDGSQVLTEAGFAQP
jgi:molybdate transport system substrate-binding protein